MRCATINPCMLKSTSEMQKWRWVFKLLLHLLSCVLFSLSQGQALLIRRDREYLSQLENHHFYLLFVFIHAILLISSGQIYLFDGFVFLSLFCFKFLCIVCHLSNWVLLSMNFRQMGVCPFLFFIFLLEGFCLMFVGVSMSSALSWIGFTLLNQIWLPKLP